MEKEIGSGTALILAGAVAKGAFEAGVLSVLANRRGEFPISRVVGASSGALNASIYAAGIRAGRQEEAAAHLAELWRVRGGWHDVFKWSLGDVLHLRGAGTHGDVLELMNEAVGGWFGGERHAVELRIALTDLTGEQGSIGAHRATTFERIRAFRDDDFDSPAGWERIARTAIGSATLPVIYAPVDVPGVGPCLDGGLVNNTPIKQAIDGGIARVIVVSAHPEVLTPPTSLEGLALVGEFIDILINERLYRDLHEAASINDQVKQLDGLLTAGRLTPEGAAAVKETLGWRPLEIIQIRPETPLGGNAISGFSDPRLRAEYIEAGRARATKVLERLALS
jgi:NTE family protein